MTDLHPNSGPWAEEAFSDTKWPHLMQQHSGGVVSDLGGAQLAPSTNGSVINIAAGEASRWGRWAQFSATTITPVAPNTQPRIDVCAIKFDIAAKTAAIVQINGTPASAPVRPTLTNDKAGVFYIVLCTYRVATGANIVTGLTDDRIFSTNPPLSVPASWLTNGGFREYGVNYSQLYIERDTGVLSYQSPTGKVLLTKPTFGAVDRRTFGAIQPGTGARIPLGTFNLPNGGNYLFVDVSAELALSAISAATQTTAVLYVDGKPITGTGANAPAFSLGGRSGYSGAGQEHVSYRGSVSLPGGGVHTAELQLNVVTGSAVTPRNLDTAILQYSIA